MELKHVLMLSKSNGAVQKFDEKAQNIKSELFDGRTKCYLDKKQ